MVLSLLFLVGVVVSGCASPAKKVEQAQLHYNLALNLLNKGDQAMAIAELLKAEKIDPQNAEVQNLLGLVYGAKGMFKEAELHLKKAIELQKPYPEADNNLCSVYIKWNKLDKAIAACKRAVKEITYGTPERAYNNMGYAYELKGDLKNAVKYYKLAILHNRHFFLAHLNLGRIYFDRKKYKAAAVEFKKAEKGCKVCPEPPYRLGLAYLRLKKGSLAKKAFKRCLELDKEAVGFGKECKYYLKLLK